jgi:hypothetical protein
MFTQFNDSFDCVSTLDQMWMEYLIPNFCDS